ncbi:iron-hydroxamate ABC transporter substrate-binding protein [Salipaludibacillus agaradhaerens]|uniref:iron-hydroxamate ABC transporter substrate-binding protein n=1 Tax=Salipaludibacillus agaradhaerens TaxID=76935 RepID=UPI000996AB5A|nr:iron-hydroxamate ABC transporter substrate-binding protein [Salipaludibacillus agaradhaerens]
MKKMFIPFALSLLILNACGAAENADGEENTGNNTNNSPENNSETITYESENGPVEVPADPQRVAVLSTFTGNVIALDVNLVGVDDWSKGSPLFEKELEGVETVSDESLEKLIELEPDLIVGLNNINNVDRLEEIAPTVTFTYGQVDYLTQHIEIGKLLNKEEEAQAWVDDFEKRAEAAGEDIKAHIGEDATVSVFENFNKQLYIYGDNWGRGTEVLYQAMELEMPEKVEEMALEDGYYALSPEVLPDFAGDYMIFSKDDDTDNSFTETETYQNIPAVQNGRVFEANAKAVYFNDPISLDYQLEFFQNHFLDH